MFRTPTLMVRIPLAYVIAQVITGIEIGVLAAALVLLADWQLIVALGVVFPFGLPLVSLQMAGVIAILGSGNLRTAEHLQGGQHHIQRA